MFLIALVACIAVLFVIFKYGGGKPSGSTPPNGHENQT